MLNPVEKGVVLRRLGFDLNPAQAAIANDASLVRLVAGGERAGKSLLAGAEIAAAAVESSLLWIVGSDYSQARTEFRYAYDALKRAGAVRSVSMPSDGRWVVRLKTGGIITIVPELPSAVGEYTPEQRRMIDARLKEGLEDIKAGRTHGPFDTADEMIAHMKGELKKRAVAKKLKRSR